MITKIDPAQRLLEAARAWCASKKALDESIEQRPEGRYPDLAATVAESETRLCDAYARYEAAACKGAAMTAIEERESVVSFIRAEAASLRARAAVDGVTFEQRTTRSRQAESLGKVANQIERGEHR